MQLAANPDMEDDLAIVADGVDPTILWTLYPKRSATAFLRSDPLGLPRARAVSDLSKVWSGRF